MRRSRAPSNWPGPFFAARSWAGCTTNMFGFDLRQAQLPTADWQCSSRGLVGVFQPEQSADHHGVSTSSASRIEPGTMPADKGVRLDDRQRIANFREQPIETNEYHSVDRAEREFLWSSSPQNVDLLPQRPNLGLKHYPRPDQIDNQAG